MPSSLYWKRRLGELMQTVPSNRDVILIYHSVAGGEMSTLLSAFEEQMSWLEEHAEVVSLDALLSVPKRGAGQLRVALTFDDGYRTLYDNVMPVLAKRSFPATVYLNTGHIREAEHELSDGDAGHYPNEAFLTWSEVASLSKHKWTIGSHGAQHLDLTRQDQSVIASQLAISKQIITERTGRPCEHFSYTWGRHNEVVRMAVAVAGYRTAVAGEHRPLGINENSFALPRLDIRREYALADFAAVVSGAWDWLGYYQRAREIFR